MYVMHFTKILGSWLEAMH